MNAHKRMTRARASLILSAPFFGSLALQCDLVECEADISETMATDGQSIFYYPPFVDECSDTELRGVIAHEVHHVAKLHHTRRGNRDPKLWNVATDYNINGELIAEGFKLPEGVLVDPRFDGMSAEAIFSVLDSERPKQSDQGGKQSSGQGQAGNGPMGQQGQGGRQLGDVLDAAPGDAAATKAAEIETMSRVAQAANAAAMMPGQGSEIAKRMITEMRTPKADIWSVLRRFVDMSARTIESWSTPNRRFISSGLYLPGREPDGISRLGIVIDVSGSINDQAWQAFYSNLLDMIDDAGPDLVDVIQCNTKIVSREQFERDDPVTITPQGGGGTDLSPALRELQDAAAIVVFTDCRFGKCDPFDPGVPVLWARWGQDNWSPSFGEVIDVPTAA